MDSLTHALLGLAIGALRKPDGAAGARLSPTDRATLLASVLAAELPDLDYLWPAENAVMGTLKAHRGFSHSLLFAPVVALVATLVAKVVFREARPRAAYPFALGAVLFGHILADAWTGWGTRLWLPFSSSRVALDWMMVLDPWFTLPLAAGALGGLRFRHAFRRAVLLGAAVAVAYLGLRIGLEQRAATAVRDAYPQNQGVQVFPLPLSVTTFRYVASFREGDAVGEVGVFSPPAEQARDTETHAEPPQQKHGWSGVPVCGSPYCRAERWGRSAPTLREVLRWARFPVVRIDEGTRTVEVADLRYYLKGKPTLKFVLELDSELRLESARLERGGSMSELFVRLRR
jgi:inner membrane protein